MTGNESPQSISFTAYYKGYAVTITKREADAKVAPLVEDITKAIDSFTNNDSWKPSWKPSWNPQTNREVSEPEWMKPDEEKPVLDDEGNCTHAHTEILVSGGFKKPENKGRSYKTCKDCKKFLGWV